MAGVWIKDLLFILPYANAISLKIHKWQKRAYYKCAKSFIEAFPWRYRHGWPISNHEDVLSGHKYLLISITSFITAEAISSDYCNVAFDLKRYRRSRGYVQWSFEHPLDIRRVADAPLRDFSIRGNIPAKISAKPDKGKGARAIIVFCRNPRRCIFPRYFHGLFRRFRHFRDVYPAVYFRRRNLHLTSGFAMRTHARTHCFSSNPLHVRG